MSRPRRIAPGCDRSSSPARAPCGAGLVASGDEVVASFMKDANYGKKKKTQWI